MKTSMIVQAAVLAAVLAFAAGCYAAKGPLRDDLGRTVKLRILVDKVMQPQAGWVTEEWMVKETADAGFNVYCPRKGYGDLRAVRDVTRWCRKYGIYHMPWMRGTLAAPSGPESDGKRLLWANGAEQPLWSPNSDELWDWMNRYIVEYAKLSTKNRYIIGVFLDFENYAPGGKMGNCYGLSYDDIIMAKFADAKGLKPPKLEPAERKKWLEDQGLHDEFARFQIDYWRKQCRRLRKAIDQFNPKFQFCIYPAPGTLFMTEAAYPEWATKEAPLILADATTYGRPQRYTPEATALEINRHKLQQNMRVPKRAGIPFVYVGGIDPVVQGADPEFCGKNAVMISQVADGYWVFYEGPTYTKDHPDYFKWFTWANKAISQGRLDAWHEPRQAPEAWVAEALKPAGRAGIGRMQQFPPVYLRGTNMLIVAAKGGQPVHIELAYRQVGSYTADLNWYVKAMQGEDIASGTIPRGERGIAEFTAPTDGIYSVLVSAGSCACSVLGADVPLALYAGDGLSVIYGAKRLYFKVPRGLRQFTLSARTGGEETVRLSVYDPEGALAGTGQTTPKRHELKLTVSTGGHAGEVWSLSLTNADEGVLEDVKLTMGPELAPVLSLAPDNVFERQEN